MLNISHTRLLAAALGCLAVAAASISLAQDQQPSAAQPNQPAAGTQQSPPADSPTDAKSAAQQQPASPTTQPASQPGEQPGANQPSNNAQRSANQPANARSSNSRVQDWPAPERYNSSRPGISDSRSGEGASLGVSITGDTQGITITRVYPGTPAQQMGLRPRDRITSVNGQNVGSSDEFITVIRRMNAGDEVELSIIREDNPTALRGKLEAFSEARRRAPVASSEDWSPNPLSNAAGQTNSLRTTSYEERNQSGRSQSGDIEARLSRVEQQLSQLARDVTEIRNAIQYNPATSPAKSDASPAGRTSPGAPSAIQPAPGQPPNNSPPPQNR